MSGQTQTTARCPDCGRVGFDDCERASCRWDQWNDGTRVTAKQRADGFVFAEKMNAYLEKRRPAPMQPLLGVEK
jgi:hypothetical protein